jgi:hypothetical protein
VKPYFILATPRSRTTWLAAYLYRDKCPVRHDASIYYPSLEAFAQAIEMQGFAVVDTALAIHWRWLRERFPQAPLVCIMRSYDEVIASAKRIGIVPGPLLRRIYAEVALCAVNGDSLLMTYQDLSFESRLAELCDHIGVPWDLARYKEMSEMRIDTMMSANMRRMLEENSGVYLHAHA